MSKKKIKDLTLEELLNLHQKQDSCLNCPLGFDRPYQCFVIELMWISDRLETEVEVNE